MAEVWPHKSFAEGGRKKEEQTTAVMGSRPRGKEAQEAVGEVEWENDWMYLASLITRCYSSSGNSPLSVGCLTRESQREQAGVPTAGSVLVWKRGQWKQRRGSATLSFLVRSEHAAAG